MTVLEFIRECRRHAPDRYQFHWHPEERTWEDCIGRRHRMLIGICVRLISRRPPPLLGVGRLFARFDWTRAPVVDCKYEMDCMVATLDAATEKRAVAVVAAGTDEDYRALIAGMDLDIRKAVLGQ